MYRFSVATFVVCASSLLALQLFVSFTPVYAAAPNVTITSPAAGSWQNFDASFPVGYDALTAGTCELQTQDGSANPWVSRGAISCGSNQTTAINAGVWCTTEGPNQCGVRVQTGPTPIEAFNKSTPGVYDWTVPVGVTSITVDARGGYGGFAGGLGGRVQATISVTPGELLRISVGSHTGASDIRRGSFTLADRFIVAGGGGGAGEIDFCNDVGFGGHGGGLVGGAGIGEAGGGSGGTQTDGGTAGGNGSPGGFGFGGAGGTILFWGGAGGSGWYGGGGGGGGHDGDDCDIPLGPGGGGGGSSYCGASCSSTTHTTGFQVGNGQVIITYSPPGGDSDQEYFSIDASAPTVTSFTASDGATTVDATSDPLTTTAGTITFDWTATDHAAGSGIEHFELWRAADAGGIPWVWSKIGPDMPPATTSTPHNPGGGAWWYSIHAFDKADHQTPADPILIVINQAPQVNVGGGRNIDFAGPINIDATVTDDGLPLPPALTMAWTKISGPGDVTFGSPTSADTSVSFSTPGLYVLRLTADDGQLSAFAEIEIGPLPHGLVPCGVDRDNPATLNWNEKDPCELKHTFLLVKNLIDFTLWKLTPIIVVIMVVATGAIFYFSWGSVNTLATVRRIWRYIGIGVLILMFSWLFLNFFLGILGFDINIFGRWTEITI